MVDSRILEMVFKNKDFEKGIDESISSLEKLDKSVEKLDGSNGSKALDTIGAAASQVSVKFNMLEVAAFTALQNITNRAVNAGIDLAKSLSIDQVTAGWSKYEDKTTSMQTIVNATRTETETLEQATKRVSDSLDKLNWFTDETSYNFTDMVSNIGKFTSMGKELDDSIEAMQGISVWASVSGQGVNEASRAMYNLAQALGTGAVKLQDWKSIENANMATKEFKETVLEEAAAMGTLDKKFDEATNSYKYYLSETDKEVNAENFNSTLAEEWFNSDVLMDVLKEYGKFSTKLSETVEDTGMEATELLGILNDDDFIAAADKVDYLTKYVERNRIEFENEEMTVKDLADTLELLNSDEYALSKKAFAAAQEAKTFSEAIAATKDAVSTNWMNIFEQIFGNYVEAKEIWSQLAEDLYSIFVPSTDAILETVKAWRELEEYEEDARGTRKELMESVHNLLSVIFDLDSEVTSFASIISDAWDEIFPSSAESNAFKIANAVIWFTEQVQRLTSWVDEHQDSLKNFFTAIFSSIKVVKTILSGLFKTISFIFRLFSGASSDVFWNVFDTIINKINEINNKLLDGRIEKFFFKIKLQLGKIATSLTPVKDVLEKVISKFKDFIAQVKTLASGKVNKGLNEQVTIMSTLSKIAGGVAEKFLSITSAFKKSDEASGNVSRMAKFLSNVYKIVKALWKVISDTFNAIIDGFNNAFDNASVDGIVELIKSGMIVTFMVEITKAIKKLLGIGDGLSDLKDSFSGVFESLSDSIKSFQKNTDAKVFKSISMSILMLALALLMLSSVDPMALSISVGAITTMMLELLGALKTFTTLNLKDIGNKGLNSLASAMIKIAAAILILALALKVISSLNPSQMMLGITGITVLILDLTASMIMLSKYGKKGSKAAKYLMKMAAAVFVLALAVRVIGSMDPDRLSDSIIAITVLLAALTIAMIAVSKFAKGGKKDSAIFLALAASMVILAGAVYILGQMDTDALIRGVAAIGILLAEIALFLKATSKTKKMVKAGAALILISTSMVIFAKAMERMAKLDADQILNALVAFGVIFAEIALFMNALKTGGNMISTATGMLLLATGMVVMSSAIKAMGEMSTEELLKGLIGLAGALATVVIAMNFVPDGVLAGAAAMLVMSVAILALVPALKAFGEMSIGEIVKSMLMLVGTMAVFVGAMMLLAPLGPVVLAAAGAFALFGVAMLAIGAGILEIAAALAILGTSATGIATVLSAVFSLIIASLPALIEAIGLSFVALVTSIAESIDAIVSAFVIIATGIIEAIVQIIPEVGAIIGAVCKLIIDYAPMVFEALTVILSGALDMLIELTPKALEWLGELLNGILDLLIETTPKLLLWITELLAGIILVLDITIPLFIKMIEDVLSQIIESLNNLIPKVGELIGTLLDTVINLLVEYIPKIANAALDILQGLLDAIEDHIEDVVATALRIVANFIKGIADGLPDIIQAGFDLVISFIQGLADAIDDNSKTLFEAVSDLFWAIIGSIGDLLEVAWEDLKKAGKALFDNGFIKGIGEAISSVVEKVKEVINKIVGKFTDSDKDFKEVGSNILEGIGEGIKNAISNVVEKAKNACKNIKDAVTDFFDINSPSRVFRDEVGKYLMLGMAEGIEKNVGAVTDSAEDASEETLDAFSSAMDKVFDLINSDEDFTPTIAPVLDLSNIQNGGRLIDSMFGNASVGLAANAYNKSRQAASQNSTANAINAAMKQYAGEIADAINRSSNNSNVTVTLSADTDGLFRVIKTQNERIKASTGKSAFI